MKTSVVFWIFSCIPVPGPEMVPVSPTEDYSQWKLALGSRPNSDPASFSLPADYRIELLHSAGPNEGSWVSMEFDPRGRLIIAREDRGLLRVNFDQKGNVNHIDSIEDTLKECRGLLYAHDALYVNANESRGLYRLRDTDGDDRFDEVKLLLKTGGSMGHGRNDLALGPDGQIYAIHGDAVELPQVDRDLTSPYRDQGPRAPSGFVLRTDPDGERWELVAIGMRNPYGIDFNPDGEMFTYDADAEYDTGASWYRPTRILHLQPGADYGWRAVTKSWPAYFPDSPDAAPPALDIGRGSPTSVKFGTDSRFPERYRRALFVLDWAYGRILAVHMTPRGAGYAMRAETFLKGRPFNVTDLDFGPDGAMYVLTGGRKTRSGLYRVRYVGQDSTALAPTTANAAERELRVQLEAFHGRQDPAAIDMAWPHLDSPDPFLRHAARIAVEHQPIDEWRSRALSEDRPLASLTALMALARGSPKDHGLIVDRLGQLSLESISANHQQIALRNYDIVLSHHPELAARFSERLDSLYPAGSFSVNEPLSRLLAKWNPEGFVRRTLDLLDRAPTQREQFHSIYVLKDAREGWDSVSRERYFRWLARMRTFIGGEGMPGFISRIQADAVATLTDAEKRTLEPLLARQPAVIEIPPEATNRPFVRDWKTADLEDVLDEVGKKRNFAQGERMFRAAACVACHRVGTIGAAVGPDLTSVSRRFGRRDLLESIVNPDKVVAEQYRRDVITMADGRVIVGSILEGGDYRDSELRVMTNPLRPSEVVSIAKNDIDSHERAETSVMPGGLLNTLSREEIIELLAYLEAAGDPNQPVFQNY